MRCSRIKHVVEDRAGLFLPLLIVAMIENELLSPYVAAIDKGRERLVAELIAAVPVLASLVSVMV